MIQDIITYLIVISAFYYAGYRIWKVFREKWQKPHKKMKDGPRKNGCGSCTAECMFRDVTGNDTEGCPVRHEIISHS